MMRDDDVIEGELCALVKGGEDEKRAAEEREALEDSKRLGGGLEVKTPLDVPEALGEPEGVYAQKTPAFSDIFAAVGTDLSHNIHCLATRRNATRSLQVAKSRLSLGGR
ncbi:hypothetical protein BDM02DRAFT_3116875 [Thelephora ganbajun]|uniref:Uncharacterized protein n=1 Tax=Thelephora ganbajun TaxID=370292 RepID=A0ACB6ZDU0_THEGA|nr:hypothetical protein BDM02DRAFT_3116875 [Thelephora ganbajun]